MMRKALGTRRRARCSLGHFGGGRAVAPAPPPAIEQATRALIEGRYDEIAGLLDKLDAQDPTVAALIAPRGDRARTLSGGRNGAPPDRAARADERRGARTRSAAADARARRTPTPFSSASRRSWRTAATDAGGSGPRRPRAARARPLPGGERRVPRRRARRRRAIRRSTPPGASCSSRSTTSAEALKSFQAALHDDPKCVPALLGSARALADDDPPQAHGDREDRRSRSIRRMSCRARVSRRRGDRCRPATTMRASRCRARSTSTRRASTRTRCSAALAYVEDKTPEFEAGDRQGAGHHPELRRGLPRRRRAGRAQLSLRRSRRARAEGDSRSTRSNRAASVGSGRASAADRRRAAARDGARAVVQARSASTTSPTTCCR